MNPIIFLYTAAFFMILFLILANIAKQLRYKILYAIAGILWAVVFVVTTSVI